MARHRFVASVLAGLGASALGYLAAQPLRRRMTRPSSPAGDSQQYRLTFTCLASEADRIVRLLMLDLDLAGVRQRRLERLADESGLLEHVTAWITCTAAQRRGIARFVYQVGLLPSVRAVHWQNLPGSDATQSSAGELRS